MFSLISALLCESLSSLRFIAVMSVFAEYYNLIIMFFLQNNLQKTRKKLVEYVPNLILLFHFISVLWVQNTHTFFRFFMKKGTIANRLEA